MSTAAISLALTSLNCNQRELAEKLGVSAAQVSKWKKGEPMSSAMLTRLQDLAGLADLDPDFVNRVGGTKAARQWASFIKVVGATAFEFDNNAQDLLDELNNGVLIHFVMNALAEMGVDIPKPFPYTLTASLQRSDGALEWEEHPEPIARVIFEMLSAYAGHKNFFWKFFDELSDPVKCSAYEDVADLESSLLFLAAIKLEDVPSDPATYARFVSKVLDEMQALINEIKVAVFADGLPFRQELSYLVDLSPEELSAVIEDEHLDFTQRVHPDVYMDELLKGVQGVADALPALFKRLDKLETNVAVLMKHVGVKASGSRV